jgi:predicted transcriptional regulator
MYNQNIAKQQYEDLQSKVEKLQKENLDLKQEITILKSSHEVLTNIESLVESSNTDLLRKTFASIEKRYQLAQILGM